MTPTLPDLLTGFAIALATPLPEEASGDFAQGRVGILAMLAGLAAQEAERGPAARVWENGALRSLFARCAGAYDGDLDGALASAGDSVDTDLSWSGMDRANAGLRRLLISLHDAAEARGDRNLDREILALYVEMAKARRLQVGG